MFNNCYSLYNLYLSNFNSNNIINISYMFYNCPSFLVYLDISNFQSYNLNEVEKIFSYIFKLFDKR